LLWFDLLNILFVLLKFMKMVFIDRSSIEGYFSFVKSEWAGLYGCDRVWDCLKPTRVYQTAVYLIALTCNS